MANKGIYNLDAGRDLGSSFALTLNTEGSSSLVNSADDVGGRAGRDSKNGLRRHSFQVFSLNRPNIPPKSKIISAKLFLTASVTESGSVTSDFGLINRDGLWDNITNQFVFRQWVEDTDSESVVFAETSGGGTVLARGNVPLVLGQATEFFGLNFLVDGKTSDLGLGQWYVAENTGTLGQIRAIMTRVGSPTGNVWFDVYELNSAGELVSDILASSDTLSSSSFTASASGAIETFTVSGSNQITLTSGTNYMFVSRSDSAFSDSNYPVHLYTFTHGTDTRFSRIFNYSKIGAFGRGSYGSQMDVGERIGDFFNNEFIEKTFPDFTAGTEYEFNGLENLIQSWVDDPSYIPMNPICIHTRQTANTDDALRDWDNARLEIEFEPRKRVFIT